MAILISALVSSMEKKTLFSAAASTKNLKTPRKCVVVPQLARRAIIPERKSANLAAQLKAQVQLRAQRIKGQREATGAAHWSLETVLGL